MRLVIEIKGKFYYDIGLRGRDTISPKTIERCNDIEPRFLEDFIDKYGKDKINIISYGTYSDEIESINQLLD